MVPRSIRQQLIRLRRRELLLRFAWGTARWVALVLVLLLPACLTDYWIDRSHDTPWGVRVALFVTQIAVAAVAGFRLLLWPMLRRPSDTELALWIEDKMPGFRHRLISAVQLNQPNARTEGMSPELIAVVTREAERLAEQAVFASLADQRRFLWSAGVFVPVAAAGLLLVLFVPLSPVLLARQLLFDVEIPRKVHLRTVTREIWPSGDKVLLEFHVTGADGAEDGEVVVDPHQRSRERYPLKYGQRTRDGALYTAQLPPASVDFVYWAYLGDGRTRQAAEVRFVPRPVVTDIAAWVQLPISCGVKPGGVSPFRGGDFSDRRYEVPNAGGDLTAIPGSAVRLRVKLQKPVKLAEVKLLGAQPGPMFKLSLDESGEIASGVFGLPTDATGYQILVADEYGFHNQPQPRRSIKIVPEEPPQVTLLPPSFPDPKRIVVLEEDVLEGMPVPPGGAIPIAYTCLGTYGLCQARLLYRFPKKMDSGETPAEEDPWEVLELNEVKGGPKTGQFVLHLGRFAKTTAQVPFHAVPSRDPQHILGRTQGGGRWFFQTEKLFARGQEVKLKPGDQVEFCVEVFAGHPGDGRPSGRSEPRVVSVVSWDDWDRWCQELRNEEERLRKLDQKQRGVFDK